MKKNTNIKKIEDNYSLIYFPPYLTPTQRFNQN